MSKQLAIIVILVVSAVAVAWAQADNSTSVAVQDDDDGSSPSLISRILSAVESLLKTLLTPIVTLVSGILTLVGTLVGSILSLVGDILSFVLTPVEIILDLVDSVVGFIFNELTAGGEGLAKVLITVLSFVLSELSGLVLGDSTSGDTSLLRRAKRDLMDSVMGTMIRSIFYLPYRIVRNVLDAFVVPFDFVYTIVLWPLQYVYGDNGSDDLTYSHAIATRSVYTDLTSFLTSIISSILLNISESTQAALYETLKLAWAWMKQVMLPNLDSFIVSAMGSGWVPANVASWLSTLHIAYTWLHLFGII